MLSVPCALWCPDDTVVRPSAKGGLCRLFVRGCFFCIRTTKEASGRHDPSLLLVVPSGTRGSDARFAMKEQDSSANDACGSIVNQTAQRPVSSERRVVAFG